MPHGSGTQLEPHPFQPRGTACIGELAPVHEPVIGRVLQASAVGAEELFDGVRGVHAGPVEILLGQGIEDGECGGTRLPAFLQDPLERRERVDVSGHLRSVEGLLPIGKWVRLSEHEITDDEALDVREVAKDPQGVATAPRGGEHHAVIAHVFDASQDDVFAPRQVLPDEIDRLHLESIHRSRRGAGVAGRRGWRACPVNRSATVAVGLSLLLGCADPGAPTELSDVFIEVGRVELEESEFDPIVRIDHIGRLPGGGFILADRHAGRVRLFDAEGRETRVLGQPGEGPGELDEPSAATLLPDGSVVVVQRGDPRLTVFEGDSASVIRVPGAYGYWVASVGDRLIAGVATPQERFAVLDLDGEAHRPFGSRDPAVAATPFWVFFARENAAVLGDEIAINTSFFPTIRIHGVDGDSLRTFGSAPPGWIDPMTPPVEGIQAPGDRQRIEEWARSFTVVKALAAVGADHLVVQYGRHEPNEVDSYEVAPRSIDVYEASGRKVAEDLELSHPVVGGGEELLVLTGEPPRPWTIARYAWKEPEGASP